MLNRRVDVFASGAVRLGSEVVCDGLVNGYSVRVQTHIHDDHMGDFDRSKGLQDLVMSPETYELLVAERNAELAYRDNLHRVEPNVPFKTPDGSKLRLLPSNHMLGASQVEIELPDGLRLGYSGDFGWPLRKVIQVDELVVDSTYGSPRSVRHYSQESAEECLQEVVCQRLRHGPVHVKAHRGTIERVLQILSDNVRVPILASDKFIKAVQVYQHHGFAVGHLEALHSCAGQEALLEKSYVRLYSKGDGFGNEPPDGTTVICSAFMVRGDNPLLKFSDQAYRIALSNHADFNETIEYVKATGARLVVTDNTRNHGLELAAAINQHLEGVQAVASTNTVAPRCS